MNVRCQMKRILLIAFLLTSATKAQWTVHQAPANILSGIYFADSLNGWVAGNDGLFHTTSSGDDWELQRPGQTGDIAGLSSQECWVTGVGDRLLHTTNGGTSWTSVFLGSALDSISSLGRICFVSPLHGWVVARRNQQLWVLKTADAGASWYAHPVGRPYAQPGFCTFVDTLTGWVMANGDEVFQTIDGGVTWSFMSFAWLVAYDIQFVTRSIGWVSAAAGTEPVVVAKTTDAGQTWSLQHGWAACWPYLSFADTANGWVLTDCFSWVEIVHTSDGGATWASQFTYSPPFSNRRRIYFSDPFHGWAIGEDGVMFRTTNGGVTSLSSDPKEIVADFELYQNYPNPFNPETHIRFQLPKDDHVRLVVYDLLGQEVATLVSEFRKAGRHDVTFATNNLSSGVYFYRLQAGIFHDTKKLLVLR